MDAGCRVDDDQVSLDPRYMEMENSFLNKFV